MRKVTFIETFDKIKKLMIYASKEGAYVFGYDCLQDTSAIWDNWFETIEDAEGNCEEIYKVEKDDWIDIPDPLDGCQHDFILPTKVTGRENGNPQWGKFQIFINNRWGDNINGLKYLSFEGLTGNERLFVSGLIDEFDNAKANDKVKARKILHALKFDKSSISKIVRINKL